MMTLNFNMFYLKKSIISFRIKIIVLFIIKLNETVCMLLFNASFFFSKFNVLNNGELVISRNILINKHIPAN